MCCFVLVVGGRIKVEFDQWPGARLAGRFVFTRVNETLYQTGASILMQTNGKSLNFFLHEIINKIGLNPFLYARSVLGLYKRAR